MTSTTSSDCVRVIEDDPTAQLRLTELVRMWGFVTEAAADGEEAPQRIIAVRPFITISDLVKLRMGGLELLRAVRTVRAVQRTGRAGVAEAESDICRHTREEGGDARCGTARPLTAETAEKPSLEGRYCA